MIFTEDKRTEIVKKLKKRFISENKKNIYFFDTNVFGRNIC